MPPFKFEGFLPRGTSRLPSWINLDLLTVIHMSAFWLCSDGFHHFPGEKSTTVVVTRQVNAKSEKTRRVQGTLGGDRIHYTGMTLAEVADPVTVSIYCQYSWTAEEPLTHVT